MKKIDRTGEERLNKSGSKMIIIRYGNANDIDIYFPEYDWVAYNRLYKNLNTTICPYETTVCNIGYLGEGKYNKYQYNVIYDTWHNMLRRCYDKERQKKQPTYIGCDVCEEWHNFQNFAKWYEENYYEIEGQRIHLDKDILIKGNKIYSPENCIFVPQRINGLFVKNNKRRGGLPIGVHWKKKNQKFQVECGIIKDNKRITKYLGLYDTPEEAFQCYKQFKENYIKQVADEYKDKIPNKLYEALMNYEVEETD